MKKLRSLLITLLLFITLTTAISAGNSYSISELNMTIEAPENWVVMTRNAEDNAVAEAMLGVDSGTLVNYLVQNQIYINFLSKEGTQEIFVNMFTNDEVKDIVSINKWSNRQLEQFAESVSGLTINEMQHAAEEMEFEGVIADGVQWVGYEIYEQEQVKFIKLYTIKSINGVAVYSCQYSTIQNGQTINISISSYEGEISDSLEKTAKEIVDSIVFTELAEGKKPVDYYTLSKNILMGICIIGIIVMAPTFLKIRKQKLQENTPLDKE